VATWRLMQAKKFRWIYHGFKKRDDLNQSLSRKLRKRDYNHTKNRRLTKSMFLFSKPSNAQIMMQRSTRSLKGWFPKNRAAHRQRSHTQGQQKRSWWRWWSIPALWTEPFDTCIADHLRRNRNFTPAKCTTGSVPTTSVSILCTAIGAVETGCQRYLLNSECRDDRYFWSFLHPPMVLISAASMPANPHPILRCA
jgi:hypothetical protein